MTTTIAVLADSALYSPRTTGTTQGTAFPMPPSGYITPDLRRNIYSSGGKYMCILLLSMYRVECVSAKASRDNNYFHFHW